MEEVVKNNRDSIASKGKEGKVCAICQSEMEPLTIGTIECCSHSFCFDCIKHWGTSCANTCPLCKKRFNIIKHKDGSGKDQETRVLNRNQGANSAGDNAILIQIDDSMDNCYVCGSDRDPQLLMICDLCDYMVAHTYCCGFNNTFPEDWMCLHCEELLGIESDYDAEVSEGEESSSSEDDFEFIRRITNTINSTYNTRAQRQAIPQLPS